MERISDYILHHEKHYKKHLSFSMKMVIKVALIGSHMTGKTVICHELVAELKKRSKNAVYLGEIARECPLPINEQTTPNAQKWILFTQMAREIDLEERYEHVICDRSILDNYIYHIYKFGKNMWLEPMIIEHMQTYNYLFKVPINPDYSDNDSVRSVDPGWQREIDELLGIELRERRIPFHHYTNLEETLKIILGE